jgi:hypothetical protein
MKLTLNKENHFTTPRATRLTQLIGDKKKRKALASRTAWSISEATL